MGVKIGGGKSQYADHLSSTPIQGTTTMHKVKNLGGGVKEEQLVESKDHQLSQGQVIPADKLYHVEVAGGMTLNLGNFESARIDVRITVPCTKESLEDSYEFGSSWVSEKIAESVKAAKGE